MKHALSVSTVSLPLHHSQEALAGARAPCREQVGAPPLSTRTALASRNFGANLCERTTSPADFGIAKATNLPGSIQSGALKGKIPYVY